jgi:hypothetical protein
MPCHGCRNFHTQTQALMHAVEAVAKSVNVELANIVVQVRMLVLH